MKVKKPLLLVAFVLLLVALVLAITGMAVAAPATAVKGTVEFQSWERDASTWGPPDAKGNWEWPNQVMTWKLHGDLEGTYVMQHHLLREGQHADVYFLKGEATFTGTFKGQKTINWSATVKGAGRMHPGYEFAGKGPLEVRSCLGHEGADNHPHQVRTQ